MSGIARSVAVTTIFCSVSASAADGFARARALSSSTVDA
jgi:hypothetical protein